MTSMIGCPVVGAVTVEAAKIGVRTDAAADVLIEYDTSSGINNPTATSEQSTVAADDFTTTFEIDGLSTDTRYWYRVKVDGVIQDPGVTLRFDTFPASGDFAFVVFADVAPTDRSADAYTNAGSALFGVQLGDLDHRNPTTLSAMRQMHRDMKDRTKSHGSDFVNRILSKRALVRIWDDHDYGGQDEDKNFAGRADAWKAFDEHWPTYDRPNAGAGLWHKFACCDAEFFVLDLRSQRDDNTDTDNSAKSMLDGDGISNDQKDWLLSGLKNSTATWKIILSSVSTNGDARPASDDLWHSFSTEAAEIADWIADESIGGVIVLSGDIHTGGGIDDGTNGLFGVPEMTVPHTNLAGGNKTNLGTWSEGVTAGKPGGAGYGLVEVSASSVTLTVKDEDGVTRRSYTVT